MRYKTLMTAMALCLMPAAVTWAAQQAPSSGHIAAGKAIAKTCAACHGTTAASEKAGVPYLAGQHASYLEKALTAYKTGARSNKAMQAAVAGLSKQDMADAAAYFASLKSFSARPPQPGQAPKTEADRQPFAAARKLTAMCAGCHGEDGNSEMPATPSLAGQHDAYLMAAMQDYRKGTRGEPMMQGFVKPLSLSQIEDIAYFYAAMVPKKSASPGKGDPLAGIAASAPCASCHGVDGNSSDAKNPRLAGLSAEYLIAAIDEYKTGKRKNAVMHDQVVTLRDGDVADIAAYYATKQPRALPIRKPLTVGEWTARCNRCHGAKGVSTDPRFPVLAGQDEAYLAKAIELYHRGTRKNALMYAMSFLMTKSDIKTLAAYYARQRKP